MLFTSRPHRMPESVRNLSIAGDVSQRSSPSRWPESTVVNLATSFRVQRGVKTHDAHRCCWAYSRRFSQTPRGSTRHRSPCLLRAPLTSGEHRHTQKQAVQLADGPCLPGPVGRADHTLCMDAERSGCIEPRVAYKQTCFGTAISEDQVYRSSSHETITQNA